MTNLWLHSRWLSGLYAINTKTKQLIYSQTELHSPRINNIWRMQEKNLEKKKTSNDTRIMKHICTQVLLKKNVVGEESPS